MRQQPLFDEQDGVARAVEGDGTVVLRAAAGGDVHFLESVESVTG
jgi:hypothetical protein